MAEWPCCHDPLRFSPTSLRFVPPPSMYPPPAAEVHEPCARPLHQPAAPLQRPAVQDLEGCSFEGAKSNCMPRTDRQRHYSWRHPRTMARAPTERSWTTARAARDRGPSGHGSWHERPWIVARAAMDRCPRGHGSWAERPGIVVRAAGDRGPSGRGSWYERPWIVVRAAVDRGPSGLGSCIDWPWCLNERPMAPAQVPSERPGGLPGVSTGHAKCPRFCFSGPSDAFDQISRPKTNQI